MMLPLEDQRLDDALPGEEDALGQELAPIRIAAASQSAGVVHLDLIGKAPDDGEEVRVHDRRALVVIRYTSSCRLPPLPLVLMSDISTCLVTSRNSRPMSRRERASLLSG